MIVIQSALLQILDLGGPVVLVLLATSVMATALVLYKIWQYQIARVGRHKQLSLAVEAWDKGDVAQAMAKLRQTKSYLAPVLHMALTHEPGVTLSDRAEAEAEARFSRLEQGLGTLDLIAQLAPLLGLFGTVLGMIEAFKKLEAAGSSVDSSMLAGGIWVALFTTAAGLAVAMPTSMVLSWLTARMQRERVFANRALSVVFAPASTVVTEVEELRAAYGS